jgi:hypothetical protein
MGYASLRRNVRPREGTVEIDKHAVADKLRTDGEFDRAQQAECALPRQVDTERDAALLHQFDVNIADLHAQAADDASGQEGEGAEES